MHDEVYEAANDATAYSRDVSATAASSPSEAYANMTLESRESNGLTVNATDSDANSRATTTADTPRPPPRSSSPAKRPHSDLDDTSREQMDVDIPAGSARRGSGQSSPRATKQPPAASASRSLRATSVDMMDAASSDTTSSSNAASTATSVSAQASPSCNLSLDDQVSKVMEIGAQAPTDGQVGFVISERWLERVFARTSENLKSPEQFSKESREGEIGPVDNSDLTETGSPIEKLGDLLAGRRAASASSGEEEQGFHPLRPGLTMGQQFEILPQEAWDLIVSWYGEKEGNPTIRRVAHNTAMGEFQENIQYELYPPVFTIRKVRKSNATAPTAEEASQMSPKIVASRSDSYMDFLRAAKNAAGIDMKTKVRVWRVLNTAPTDQAPPQPSGMLTPEASPRNGSPESVPQKQTLPLAIDAADFKALANGSEREEVTGKDETNNEKYNGHMNLQLAGLGEDQVLILEEQDSKGGFASDSTLQVPSKDGAAAGNKITAKNSKGIQSKPTSGRNSPAPGPMTRGRTRGGRTRATVGLTNLGNTCYMNSALQCIRSVEELTWYFFQNKWKEEINSDNPLGHGGTIAKSYAGLVASIYAEDGASAFAPRQFKQALGKAQPLFSGYGQQDSQEFLSFLVDGLHEDLNRIKKKPYTEYPESDDNTINDPEAIKALGDKFRDIHHSRNDSVAMDLFNGFYKNTMVCPECSKVSITFDPYSLITLQLPIEQTWQHNITFVPLFGKPVRLEVDIDKNGTIKTLKEYIARRFPGTKWNHLMGAEVYSNKFYRALEDSKTIVECNISQRDDIFFYELDHVPTNYPPPKKPQKYRSMLTIYNHSSEEDIPASSSPLADKLLVPIFHRGQNLSSYSRSQALIHWPSYIVLTREEAKDYDTIVRKIIGRVAQMTTRPILSEFNDASVPSQGDSDVVITTEEDASANGDPLVQDGSVEGEDMVEVTMTEPEKTPQPSQNDDEVPEVLKPGSFIPPAFKALFNIRHTRRGKEMVPTGWSNIDANKQYELISKRIRVEPSRESSMQSVEEASNASSSEEGDDTPQFSADANESIELANESSDEEIPSIETEPGFSRGGRQKNNKHSKKNKRHQKKMGKKNGLKTYSKKGKVPEQPSYSLSDPESDEDESLIRLGEAIVLDWEPNAQEALFGATTQDEGRGVPSLNVIETFEDSELQAKKAKRAARKKGGINLDECFQETSKSEILSEDNAWYCNRCKELRRATKTLEIWTVPDILVVHLKRFSAHRTFRDKIEALVDFPVEGLDLSGKIGLPEGKSLVYDLFAVDNHYGGLGGGHYTAYAQNFFDKQWYDYNDSSVSSIRNPQSVVTSNAYLLFYRRRQDGPLGPPSIQKIVEEVYNPASEEEEDGTEEDQDAPTSRNASRSPAPPGTASGQGNGSRLAGSSRNGSSSAFRTAAGATAVAGTTALAGTAAHRLGSASAGTHHHQSSGRGLGAGHHLSNEDDIEMHGAENPPPYTDEGYGGELEEIGDSEDENFAGVDVGYPLNSGLHSTPVWDFSALSRQQQLDDDEEIASDAPNLDAGDDAAADMDLQERLRTDFGDGYDDDDPFTDVEDMGGARSSGAGAGTPMGSSMSAAGFMLTDAQLGIPPDLEMDGDDKVAEVRLDDLAAGAGVSKGVKVD